MNDQAESTAFDGAITLTIDADPRLVRPVRLALGGLASLAGFDVEAIDDLRIGVNELVATLIERGDGSALHLLLQASATGIRIEGRTPCGPGGDDEERFVLSDRVLSVVADDHGFETADGACTGWLERGLVDWDDDFELDDEAGPGPAADGGDGSS